jgi:NAD(P)-dependent dehydrogenase (short-subunit alcohol dehydrogenase family)
VSALLEIGPQPVLTALGRQCLPGRKALWLSSMGPDGNDALQMRRSLAALFAAGFDTDLSASLPAATGWVALPTYPFQRRPLRLPKAALPAYSEAADRAMPGHRLALPLSSETRFEHTVPADDRLLAEHRLFDEVIVPAAWHVALICTALQRLQPESSTVALEDVTFVQAARLPSSGLVVQLVLEAQQDGRARFRLIGRAGDADAFDESVWQTHVTGVALMARVSPPAAMALPITDELRSSDSLYETVEAAGFALGPSFRWAAEIGGKEKIAVARIASPVSLQGAPGAIIPVGLLDTCFQLMSRFWPMGATPRAFVPFRIGRFSVFAKPEVSGGLYARAACDDPGKPGDNSAPAAVTLLSPEGLLLANAEDFVFRAVTQDVLAGVAMIPLRQPVWRAVANKAEDAPWHCEIVACVPGLAGAAVNLMTLDAAEACVGLLQAVRHALDAPTRPRLVIATQGAQAAGRPHRIAPVQAALWGVARTLRQEHPSLSLGLVDLDPARPAAHQWDDLLRAAASGEPELALRAGKRLAPSLDALSPPAAQLQIGEGLYLVTGGLGALGLETASWLVEQGARYVLLAGRSPPSAAANERLGQLRRAGVQVTVSQLDVADATAESTLEAAIAATGRKLHGMVHAAGILDDGVAIQQTPARIAAVLAPKVAGALLMDRLSTRHEVRFLVLYSSVAALSGARGQSSYAAANAFLDALAHDRHARGLPALSVNWGPWAGSGMAARQLQAAADLGLAPMAPAAALRALGRALASGVPQVEIARRGGARRTVRVAAMRMPADAAPTRQRIEGVVRGRLAEALGLSDGGAIEARARLFDLGLDSLSALEVRDALETSLDRRLHATLLFDHPTVEALVDHLTKDDRAVAAVATVDDSDGAVAALSEDEAEQALLRVLERLDR